MLPHDHEIIPRDATALYKPRTVWALVVASVAILVLWLAGTPLGALDKARAVGYAVCHQIAERSFHAHGHQLPLCARCTGLYLGVLTGIAVFAARGRLRGARLPGYRVLAVLVVLGATYALDGLNSYLSIFAFYTPVYAPHNTLRLLTGLAFGLGMITVVLPVFNSLAWAAPDTTIAPVANLRELAVLYAAAAGVALAMLSGIDTLVLALGAISVAGVVLMFMVVGSVLFLALARRENAALRWRDLAIPALAGVAFAFVVIGGIDALRYVVTGTWEGFALPGG